MNERKKNKNQLLAELAELRRRVAELEMQPAQKNFPKGPPDERAELIHRLVDSVPDIIYRFRLMPEPTFDFISATVENITGYKAEDFYEDPSLGLKIIHTEEHHFLQDFIAGQLPEQPHVVRWIHKNGSVIWIEDRQAPHFEDGKLVAVEGIARDITARKNAETALAEQENLLRKIAENYPSSYISIIEKNLTIGFTSGQEFKKQGLDPQQFIGLKLKDVFGDKTALIKKHYKKTFAGEEQTFDIEINGQYQIYRTVPLHAGDGSIPRILVVVENITEKKNAELALQASEEKYKSLFEDGPLAYQSLDKDGNYLDVNLAWLKLLGYERKEVISSNYTDYLHPDSLPAFQKNFPAFKKQGHVHDVYFKIRHKKGHYLDISLDGCVGYNPDGSFRQTYCVFQDITERKQAREKLIKSEQGYRALFENSPAPLWEEDFSAVKEFIDALEKESVDDFSKYFDENPQMVAHCAGLVKILSLNQAVLKLHEAKSKDALLQGLPVIFGPESLHDFKKELVAIAEKRLSCQFEGSVLTLKGKKKYVELKWAVMPGHEKKLDRVYVSTVDITAHKKAEAELQDSRAKYQTIFDNVSDSLAYLDNRGIILNVNNRCIELYGGPREELVGKHFTKLGFIQKNTIPSLLNNLKQALTQDRFTIDFEFINKKGVKIYLECSTARMWENGKTRGIIVAARDITERKLSEHALRTSEEKWRSLTENSPDHIMLLDLDYRIQFINRTTAGLTKEEVLGRSYLDFIPAGFQTVAETCFEHVLLSGKPDSFETEYHTKDGAIEHFNVHVSQVKNARGKITALISTSHNITKRRQREKALEASETRYRNLVEHAPVCIHEVDQNGKIISMNSAGLSMHGVDSAEEIVQQNYLKTIHPKDRSRIKTLMQQAFAGAPSQFEFAGTEELGGRLFTSSFIPIPAGGGEVLRVMGITRDITARKRAERAVLESENKLRTITNQSIDGITVADLEGKYVFVNPAFCKMMGYSQEELLQMNVHDMRGPSQEKMVFQTIKTSGESTFQIYLKRKDDSEFISEISAKPITFNDSKCILGIVRDITERVRAEEKIRASEARLNEAQHLAKMGSWVLDLCDNALKWSDEVYRIFNLEPQSFDATYESFLDMIHPQDRVMVDQAYRDSIQNKSPYDNIHRLLLPGNKVKYVHERCETFYDAKGRAIRSVGTVQDITERKLAEDALRESETRYKTLFEKSADAILIIEGDKFVDCNAATVKMLHYNDKEELLQTHPWELSPEKQPDGRLSYEKANEIIAIALEKGSHRFEWEHKRKDGKVFPVEVLLTAVPFKNGKLLHTVWRDITERKKIERAQRESEEKYRVLVENVGQVLMVAQEGRFKYVNPQIYKVIGYRPDELLGKLFSDYIHPQDRELVAERHQQRIQGDEITSVYSFRIITRAGEIRWVEISIVLIEWEGRPATLNFIDDITERKEAEQALIESENLLNESQKIAFLGSYNLDIPGGKWRCSKGLEALAGIDPTYEKSMQNWIQLIHPDDRDKIQQYFDENIMQKHEPLNHEYRLIRFSDEKVRWVHDIAKLELDESGNLVRMYGTIQDITDRKTAEQALIDSEHLLTESQRVAQIGSYILDISTGVWKSSQVLDKIFGISSQYERNIEGWLAIVQTQDIEQMQNYFAVNILQKHEDFNKEYRIVRKSDGQERWVHGFGQLELNETGEPERMIGTIQDITGRKLAETELRKLGQAIEQSPSIVIITDTSGNIEYVNPKFTEVTGYSSEEVLGKNPRILQGGEMQKDIYVHLWATIRAGKEWRGEFHNKKKNGEMYWEDVRISSVTDAQGTITNFIAVKEDITLLKQVEEDKNKLEIQLRRSQKMETIGTLAGGIAHDFNNLLTPILGYSDMALMSLSEKDALYPDIRSILKAATQAKELVQQILIFSRQAEQEHKPLSLQLIVKEALQLLRPSLPATIEIRQRMDKNCCKVNADPTQMHQVIMNLCTNAFHAMEENGGVLTLELKQIHFDENMRKMHPELKASEYVRLSVTDTGIGMDPITVERIFEPFFSTKQVGKGTGLGLSVVHGIVRSHRGDITVYSEKNIGTTFHIYLPALSVSVATAKEKVKKIQRGDERILVVDDEKMIVQMLKQMLEQYGYTIIDSANSIEAYEAFCKHPQDIDLLITDLTMPGMTGLDLARKMKQLRNDLPVILITGYSETISDEVKQRYGIRHVLTKPVITMEITDRIRGIFDD